MKKQTLFIILGVAAAGVIAWLLMQRNKAAAATTAAPVVDSLAKKASSQKEEQQFKELVNIFRKWGENDLPYMLDGVDQIMSGEREMHPDYLIKGQVTLPGAFIAIFDSSWKHTEEQWREIHTAFNRIKIAAHNV